MCSRTLSAVFAVALVVTVIVNPADAQLRTPPRGAQVAPAAKPAPEPKPAPTPSAELVDLKTKLEVADKAKADAETRLTEALATVAALEQKLSAAPASPGDCDDVKTALTDTMNDAIAAKKAATVATDTANRLQRERNGLERAYKDAQEFGKYCFRILFVLVVLLALYGGYRILRANRARLFAFVVALVVLAIVLFVFVRPAGAATFSCVNPATAQALDKAYPIAVVGVDNEIKCSGSGTAVEVKDENGTVIPVTGNPSSFKINPVVANTGRASISVDGKKVSILAIGEGTDASFGNIWLDMSRQIAAPATSGVDIHVRKLLEGMACGTDTSCLTDFRRKAWGSARGSSAAAGATLRVAIVEQTLSDPRLANATKAALDAFAANMPAVGVSEARAKEIATEEAQTVVAPLHARVGNIDARVSALDDRVKTVEEGVSQAQTDALSLRQALRDARVPRSGPAGFVGATRRLVKK